MKNTTIPISFALKTIKTDECFIDTSVCNKDSVIDAHLTMSLEFIYSPNSIGITLTLTLTCKTKLVAKCVLSNYFTLDSAVWARLSKNATIDVVLPNGFVEHLLSICISTMRGYLYAKLEGTIIEGAIGIPLFYPNEFLEKSSYKPPFIICKPLV